MSLYVQRNGEVISADSRSLISKRYCTVTSAMNREFWNITSDRQNSIYVGSYGRGTAIDTSDIDILMSLPESYKNVQLMQGLTNNKPDFRIQVKGLFGTEEKRFEVVGGDKKRPATKKKSDLGWIDRLEEIDAALDDF